MKKTRSKKSRDTVPLSGRHVLYQTASYPDVNYSGPLLEFPCNDGTEIKKKVRAQTIYINFFIQ